MKSLAIFLLFFFALKTQLIFGQVVSLAPKEFYDEIKGANIVQLVDLRSEKDFQKGFIKKAVNIDYNADSFEEKLLQTFSKDKPLFIYCLDGVRSTDAKIYLKELGYKMVVELQGGFSNWTRSSKPYVTKSVSLQPIVSITDNDFATTLKNNTLVLVDFYTTWCTPCKKQDPILSKIASENKQVKLLKIDAETNEGLAKRFNVNEIPTLLLFRNGVQVWSGVGLKTEAELNAILR